jgi:hypothetical protein
MRTLKVLAVEILITTLDKAVARFPALFQLHLEEQMEKTEPDFYR